MFKKLGRHFTAKVLWVTVTGRVLRVGPWLAIVTAATLVTVACGVKADGPPDIEVDRSVCDHCRMLISEPSYAAAYRAKDTDARVFDDIACMLAAARQETAQLRFWFQDADGSGWIDGADAVFVSSSQIRTPMSGGIAAYRSRDVAQRSAAAQQGQVRTLDELLARGEAGS